MSKFSKQLLIFLIIVNLFVIFIPLNPSASTTDNTYSSFTIYGQTFTYETAPQIIKTQYEESCYTLGITPSADDEIFVPLNNLESLNLNMYRSSSTYNISYNGTYITITGSKNYSINVNSTYVGYNYISSGNPVHCLQLLLCQFNIKYKLFTSPSIDSLFGPITQSALVSFQSYANLSVDAICGPNTWKKIFTYL